MFTNRSNVKLLLQNIPLDEHQMVSIFRSDKFRTFAGTMSGEVSEDLIDALAANKSLKNLKLGIPSIERSVLYVPIIQALGKHPSLKTLLLGETGYLSKRLELREIATILRAGSTIERIRIGFSGPKLYTDPNLMEDLIEAVFFNSAIIDLGLVYWHMDAGNSQKLNGLLALNAERLLKTKEWRENVKPGMFSLVRWNREQKQKQNFRRRCRETKTNIGDIPPELINQIFKLMPDEPSIKEYEEKKLAQMPAKFRAEYSQIRSALINAEGDVEKAATALMTTYG
jgi:hypothetical protein